jgi:hypothetical protein
MASVQVDVGCNVILTSGLRNTLGYMVNQGQQGTLSPGQTARLPILNQNVNRISFSQPVSVFDNFGRQVASFTTNLSVTNCDSGPSPETISSARTLLTRSTIGKLSQSNKIRSSARSTIDSPST